MIVADTGAVLALVDADERHHAVLRGVYESDPGAWVLPWAVLPEVDHLVRRALGAAVGLAFERDVADGLWSVDWGAPDDLERASSLAARHTALDLGLVDTVVMAVAERLGASAIATLDERDFAAVELAGSPRLLPRDL